MTLGGTRRVSTKVKRGSAPVASPTAEPAAATSPTATPGNGITVLVVEDNSINQRLAVQTLRKLGYKPSVACNGAEALRSIEATPVDIVLMDILMPVMDGYEATHEMRRRGIETPIIAMTGLTLVSDRDRCFAAGMNDFLAKPVTAEALQAKLVWAMAEARRRSAAQHRPVWAKRAAKST